MRAEYVVIIVVAGALAVIAWAIAAILNRPQNPDHDIRRRVLALPGALTPGPVVLAVGADTVPAVIVAVAAFAAWVVVMVFAVSAVLDHRHPAPSHDRVPGDAKRKRKRPP